MSLKGSLDHVVGFYVEGWALPAESALSSTAAKVSLFIDGQFIGDGFSNLFRYDLHASGIGKGDHAYRIEVPQKFFDGQPHLIDIKVGQVSLPNSPQSIVLGKRLMHAKPSGISSKACSAEPATADATKRYDAAYALIKASGLFDAAFYLQQYGSALTEIQDPLQHYLLEGEQRGFKPNFYFDPSDYRANHRISTDEHPTALVHFATEGWKQGLTTSIYFDPAWYRTAYRIAADCNPLADFLAQRPTRNPNPYFDYGFYLEHNPDISRLDDAFMHFALFGVNENRTASPLFDAAFYRMHHLQNQQDVNPFEHFLRVGKAAGYSPVPALMHATARGAEGPARDQEYEQPTRTEMNAAALAERLASSGLIDTAWYVEQYPDVGEVENPALHYLLFGDREGRNPNPYFDTAWYAKNYFKTHPQEGCLVHYCGRGEREGKKPCAVFDAPWYANEYGLNPEQENVLAHYLVHRSTNRYAPNRWFSPLYYGEQYPDIAASNIDRFQHYMGWGVFEGRRGSEKFDAEFVWQRYMGNNRSINPLETFMDIGLRLGWVPSVGATSRTVHSEIKANCNAGPFYEDISPPTASQAPSIKVIAFYLTQFHAIPENDEWWGAGFTEWRNIPKGIPRFVGHYQPRVPRDFGYYELGQDNTHVMKKQVALARQMGVHGFCFYYYNFNGHRLLEKPLDAFVDDPDIEFPFSIMWANENWTRRWDGMEQDVLMRQDYRAADRDALIDDLARYLKHPQYIKADGRPVLYLYRADIIPDCRKTLSAWRKAFKKRHNLEPLLVMAQTFGCNDPTEFGFDGAVEFPPHKLGNHLPEINSKLEIYDPTFSGSVRDYKEAMQLSLQETNTPFALIKTAIPMWDNDARKQGAGMVFHGSTPALFQQWLEGLVQYAKEKPFYGENFVFINAWNEWCEGAYLEPDCHYGHAYINALARAVHAAEHPVTHEMKVVLVGHDAFTSGAQQLLIHMGKVLKNRFGVEISFVLMGDGDMVPAYEALAETYVATRQANLWEALAEHISQLKARGFGFVITNSLFSGAAAGAFADYGFEVCSLIHELPTIVREHHGVPFYEAIREKAQTVVFPNRFVHDEITREFGVPVQRSVVRAQGIYKELTVADDARTRIRDALGLSSKDRLVINIGHGDLRKGVDVFVAIADQISKTHKDIHFVWLGSQHPNMISWITRDLERRGNTNVHFIPFAMDVGSYLAASDLFFLSSREDPFPSVVLEALALGLPVATFDYGGGYVELLKDRRLGFCIPYLDIEAAAQRIPAALNNRSLYTKKQTQYRQSLVRQHFDFPDYCADILAMLYPQLRRVSVVVPNYDYAHYLDARLTSIFGQTYPVYEIIVLDDASRDESVRVAQATAHAQGRQIRLVVAEENSGNVFCQWKRGLEMATGDYLWIAEADDLSDPRFLAEMIRRLAESEDASFAFCDSIAIDATGATMYDNYKGYYRTDGDTGLDEDGQFDAKDFLRRFLAVRNMVLNASAVVWRTQHLRDVFAALGDDAFAFTCAGDWRIYVESCRLGGRVHYAAATLNMHRRHDNSVTHALAKPDHFFEIAAVQAAVRKCFPRDKKLAAAISAMQADLKKGWGLPSLKAEKRKPSHPAKKHASKAKKQAAPKPVKNTKPDIQPAKNASRPKATTKIPTPARRALRKA